MCYVSALQLQLVRYVQYQKRRALHIAHMQFIKNQFTPFLGPSWLKSVRTSDRPTQPAHSRSGKFFWNLNVYNGKIVSYS